MEVVRLGESEAVRVPRRRLNGIALAGRDARLGLCRVQLAGEEMDWGVGDVLEERVGRRVEALLLEVVEDVGAVYADAMSASPTGTSRVEYSLKQMSVVRLWRAWGLLRASLGRSLVSSTCPCHLNIPRATPSAHSGSLCRLAARHRSISLQRSPIHSQRTAHILPLCTVQYPHVDGLGATWGMRAGRGRLSA